MRYFDSRDERLGVEHVMASGALPPAFPAIRIDGEPYWDGGLYSNTPIEAVLDDKPRRSSVIFAVDVWRPDGEEPQSIWQVMDGRRTFNTPVVPTVISSARGRSIICAMWFANCHAICRPGSAESRAMKELASWGCHTTMHVIPLLASRLDGEDHTKDIDFSPAGVRARWQAGRDHTLASSSARRGRPPVADRRRHRTCGARTLKEWARGVW